MMSTYCKMGGVTVQVISFRIREGGNRRLTYFLRDISE